MDERPRFVARLLDGGVVRIGLDKDLDLDGWRPEKGKTDHALVVSE